MSNFELNVKAVSSYFRVKMPVSYTRNELNRAMRNDKYFSSMEKNLNDRVFENLAAYAR